ncbi:acetyltransferase [archaeon]|jgi:sugar O-acyltransferase (sialic acid O-acetyltransferase NeuD family)|nr:acetyltransferase [archaeon]MBT6761827.1 acetyltransferase [archaeon]
MNSQAESLEEIYIYCAGGQGRHITFLIQQIGGYKIMGFIDESSSLVGKSIKGFPVFSSIESAVSGKNEINIAIANGTPKYVHAIVKKLREYQKSLNCKVNFPNLIHPSVLYDASGVSFGVGNIINVGTNLTTDIVIGDFNYFNRYCILGHDLIVGSYCNFNAGVIIGGNVSIGNFTYLGMGTRVIQGKKIGQNVLTGAGSIIQTDVPDNAIMIMPKARHFSNQKPVIME